MRKLAVLAAVVAAVASPSSSRAQATIGLRLGYAPAMGDAYKVSGTSASMSDGVKAQIPVQLDVGFRVSPELTLGGYLSYGIGQVGGDQKDMCDTYNLDCSAHGFRLGVQGIYAFTKAAPNFTPWLGAGIGYEWATMSASGGGAKEEYSFSGFELLNLQGGVDFKTGPQFAVGPYVMLSVAQYSSGTYKFTGDPNIDIFSVADKTTHEWLSFGVRGKFDL